MFIINIRVLRLCCMEIIFKLSYQDKLAKPVYINMYHNPMMHAHG